MFVFKRGEGNSFEMNAKVRLQMKKMIILISTLHFCSTCYFDFIMCWFFFQLEETEAYHKKLNEDSLLHAPEFVIKPRSHTVWEKENVKLHCSVAGWPEPRLTWYAIVMKISHRIDYSKLILPLVKTCDIVNMQKSVKASTNLNRFFK